MGEQETGNDDRNEANRNERRIWEANRRERAGYVVYTEDEEEEKKNNRTKRASITRNSTLGQM